MAKRRILVVTGEASGDRHAARLIAALRAEAPEIEWEVFGSGGAEMRAAGAETLVDVRELAIMGLLEVLRALPLFRRVFRQLREAARTRRPDAVILVDWPEFNLRLAKRLARDGHRIFYYISPQIWAWRTYRIRTIRRHVEQMLVILPFEKEFYERHGVEVEYVGHPLLDSIRVTSSRAEFCQRHGLDPARRIIALLPGSRHSEIRYILPPLLETVERLRHEHPDWQAILPLARTFSRAEVATVPGLTIIENETANAIAAADLAVVASGTATLETAIIGTPLIVVYRASNLNWRIFHPLIRVPWVGMPNLIAGKEIAPELLQDDLTAPRLTAEITRLLGDPEQLAATRLELARVRERLGESNASARAARSIIDRLRNEER
jgi:lipid-A-disaccharide synthase